MDYIQYFYILLKNNASFACSNIILSLWSLVVTKTKIHFHNILINLNVTIMAKDMHDCAFMSK